MTWCIIQICIGAILLLELILCIRNSKAHVKTSVAKRRQPNQIDGAYTIQKE